jgi:hypothetical protein
MQLGGADGHLPHPRRAPPFVHASERRRVQASDARPGRDAVVRARTELAPACRERKRASPMHQQRTLATDEGAAVTRYCFGLPGPRRCASSRREGLSLTVLALALAGPARARDVRHRERGEHRRRLVRAFRSRTGHPPRRPRRRPRSRPHGNDRGADHLVAVSEGERRLMAQLDGQRNGTVRASRSR